MWSLNIKIGKEKMKKIALVFSAVMLTGCGTYGEPILLARMFDAQDSCQSRGRPNYQRPDFCGAGTAYSGAVIRTKDGKIIGTVK